MSSSISVTGPKGRGQSNRSRTATPITPRAARSTLKRYSAPQPTARTAEPHRQEQPHDLLVRLTHAGAGDHHAVYQFLSSVLPCPPRDSFLAFLDDPFYEPTDRMLVKLAERILAHVRLTDRTWCFGPLGLRVSYLSGLATLPQCRGQGFARRLLRAAHDRMRASGTAIGLLRTSIPHFFRPLGWAACGFHSHSRARTRDVLAQLVSTASSEDTSELSVRPWRQVELPALMRLYAERCRCGYGFIERTEAYWRWLVSRKPFDQLFVAVHGPDRMELNDEVSPIVGYAVTRDDDILELVTSPQHPQAAQRLLARACGEAVERDLNSVCLHAPWDDPLHALFQRAGGTHVCQEASQGEVLMAVVLEPARLLRALGPVLHERAVQAELSRPFELGLAIDGAKYRLALTRRSVKLAPPRLGRSYLTMNDADFTRLLLGHLDLDEAVAAGRVQASTRLAQEAAKVLFPRLPLWRAPLDEPSP